MCMTERCFHKIFICMNFISSSSSSTSEIIFWQSFIHMCYVDKLVDSLCFVVLCEWDGIITRLCIYIYMCACVDNEKWMKRINKCIKRLFRIIFRSYRLWQWKHLHFAIALHVWILSHKNSIERLRALASVTYW